MAVHPVRAGRAVAGDRPQAGLANGRGPESTGVHSGVDRLDADGIGIGGLEFTNPPTRHPSKKHLVGARHSAPLRPGGMRCDKRDHAAPHCMSTRRTPNMGNGPSRFRGKRMQSAGPMPKEPLSGEPLSTGFWPVRRSGRGRARVRPCRGCAGRALRLSTRFRSLLPSSRGLGRGPLKAKTRVRIP